MAWVQAGETWINMDQVVHIAQEDDEAVITFAVGLNTGTFPYAQRYTGEAANAIFAWLHTEATVEAVENALTLATMEDELEDEMTDSVMFVDIDDDDDDDDDESTALTKTVAADDEEELLKTPPLP